MASSISSSPYSKPCTLCAKSRDVLIRCQIDATGKWHFVCPGTCWKSVSGGVIDGDNADEHQHYRYGGVWRNKHEAVSGKKPKKKKNKISPTQVDPASSSAAARDTTSGDPNAWSGQDAHYTKNDRVIFDNVPYVCRKSHVSQERKTPDHAYSLWKQDDAALRSADEHNQSAGG